MSEEKTEGEKIIENLPFHFFDDIEKYKDQYEFYKKDDSGRIWWVDTYGAKGYYLFSFDKNKVYSLFDDGDEMTQEEKKIFTEEYPGLADFIK